AKPTCTGGSLFSRKFIASRSPSRACTGLFDDTPSTNVSLMLLAILKNVSRQVLVFDDIRQHLADIVRVHLDVLALLVRGVETDLIQHPLHNRVQAAGADILRPFIHAEGKARNLFQGLPSELKLYALGF